MKPQKSVPDMFLIVFVKCVPESNAHPTRFLVAKIEFWELGDVFGCFGRGIHFPNQIFCPIGKMSIFREMGAQKLALGEKIVASFRYKLIRLDFLSNREVGIPFSSFD